PRSPSPYSLKVSPARETLTYAQAQKMVEVDLDGRLHRISIFDPLTVITEDEMTAQDIAECNSNKENSEQPLFPSSKPGRKPPATKGKKKDTAKHSSSSSSHHHPNSHTPHHALPKPTFHILDSYAPSEAPPLPAAYYRYMEKSAEELDAEAEYDMDEEDFAWLEMVNEKRVSDGQASVSPDAFELLMDRLEKESFLESRSQGPSQSAIDEDAFCCVCLDDECLNSNVILFCDICNLAVHQECYGVPYIPEGQWLCRCCLQSPSRPVDCVLCPNKGGAFKQTSDGRWAHVVCAIWIPEVCFANTVFLEPVEGVENIPPARWKLTCYICKQKGQGASIQCHKANCYTAFHVTCAQRAGLFMKIDPVRETNVNGTTFSVKKTAFCEAHSPPGATRKSSRLVGGCNSHLGEIGEGEEVDEERARDRGAGRGRASSLTQQHKRGAKKGSKLKRKVRKSLEVVSRRSTVPMVMVPQIPSHRLNKICTGVPVQRKNQFMQRLHNYWLLKRQSRNGVPLIRRLHSHLQAQRGAEQFLCCVCRGAAQTESDEKVSAVKEELKYWQKLRHDLERARLLVELIRKREKLKREQVKVHQAAMELQLTPFLVLLRSTLDQLQEKDAAQIFAEPVNLKEVPDYLEFISQPMDFSTMRSKVEAHGYCSLADFEGDFNLMVSNCLKYNAKDTVFHRAAVRLRDLGGAILRHTQRQAQSIGFDSETGMHLPDSPKTQDFYRCSWEDVDNILLPENRLHMSPEDQLKELLDKLDMVTSMRSSGARTRRIRLLRREINSIRYKLGQQQRLLLNGDHTKPAPEEGEDREAPGPPHTATRGQRDQDPGPSAQAPEVGQDLPSPSAPAVGRRTSVLFKKAKNGAKIPKGADSPLRNGGEEMHSTPLTPTPASDAPSPSLSPSERTPRRRPCSLSGSSDSEGEKSPRPAPEGGLTNGFGKHGPVEEKVQIHSRSNSRNVWMRIWSNCLHPCFSSLCPPSSAVSPPKRSRGKPALSRVPFLEGVNGDSDYTGAGESEGQGSKRDVQSMRAAPNPSVRAVRDPPVIHAMTCRAVMTCVSATGRSLLMPFESSAELEPLDLVWAKCRGYPSYPALIIDPDMPREGLLHNGVPIPVPPLDVLRLGAQRQEEAGEKLFLVLFFDNKRTCLSVSYPEIVYHSSLKELQNYKKTFTRHLEKTSIRKSVQVAYDRAMIHLSRVRGDHGFVTSSYL
uniref:Bromodomain and PHD finger containing 3 n=1 Tax=Lepisosteus oculatus TaxID=7918 RepID=W5MZ00_LEPOC